MFDVFMFRDRSQEVNYNMLLVILLIGILVLVRYYFLNVIVKSRLIWESDGICIMLCLIILYKC